MTTVPNQSMVSNDNDETSPAVRSRELAANVLFGFNRACDKGYVGTADYMLTMLEHLLSANLSEDSSHGREDSMTLRSARGRMDGLRASARADIPVSVMASAADRHRSAPVRFASPVVLRQSRLPVERVAR